MTHWKDPDAGKDWEPEEKGTTEDEMAGWHYRLDGHEFGWTPRGGDGQGGLACCSPWSHKELDMTERLNWTELTPHPFPWSQIFVQLTIVKKVKVLVAQSCVTVVTPWTVACQVPLSMDFSRQEYWNDSHSFLLGIFSTQGLNLGLPHCRQFLYCLRHQGSLQLNIIFPQKVHHWNLLVSLKIC